MRINTIIRNLNHAGPDIYTAWLTGGATWRNEVRNARNLYSRVSADMGGGKTPRLTTPQEASTKLTHNGFQQEWTQIVMYLAAHRSSNITNLCPHSTPQCRRHCLGLTAGRLRYPVQQLAQRVRTHLLVNHPHEFAVCLIDEIVKHVSAAEKSGLHLAVRLNGASDVPWERVPWLISLLREAGARQFLDYTKWPKGERIVPDDYHLSHSVNERMSPDQVEPGDVVIVDVKRKQALPDTWAGMPVIDGDWEHGDLRFFDKDRPDAVVLLRAKGSLYGVKGDVASFVKPAVVETPVSVG